MNIKKYITITMFLGLLPLFSTNVIGGDEQWTGTEYSREESAGFQWDEVTDATHYEVKIVWTDPTTDLEYPVETTTTTPYTVLRKRSGHFDFYVRACSIEGCSNWSVSTDETVSIVDGQPGAWRVFFKTPSPTDIIIE